MATKRFRESFISGIIVFAVSLIFITAVNHYISRGYNPVPLFMYHWFTDLFVLTIGGTLGFLFLYYRGILVFERRKDFPFIYTYFSGYLSLTGLYILIKDFYSFDSYILFLYPVLLIVLGFVVSFLVLEAQRSSGYMKILLFFTLIPGTAAIAAVPALYYLNYHSYAFMLTGFLPLLASSIYSILRNDYRSLFGT